MTFSRFENWAGSLKVEYQEKQVSWAILLLVGSNTPSIFSYIFVQERLATCILLKL